MDHWRVSESAGCIAITCAGHDKDGQWPAAIAVFRGLIARRLEPSRVIVDLRAMLGY